MNVFNLLIFQYIVQFRNIPVRSRPILPCTRVQHVCTYTRTPHTYTLCHISAMNELLTQQPMRYYASFHWKYPVRTRREVIW